MPYATSNRPDAIRKPNAVLGRIVTARGIEPTGRPWPRQVSVGGGLPVQPERLLGWHPDLVRRKWAANVTGSLCANRRLHSIAHLQLPEHLLYVLADGVRRDNDVL